MVNKYFGSWKRGNYVPEIPSEPEQTEPRAAHVDWASPTLPYIVVAYRGPAYSDEKKDKAALDLLASIAFGENSDLYQRLVLKEQKVDFISPSFDDQIDGELFAIFSRVKDQKDVDYVRDQILATFKRYTTELVPQAKLDATRSRTRYGLALGMDSSEAIARIIAPYISLRRTPETLNKLFTLYGQVTPEDIRDAAARYFVDRNRTIVTLSTKGKGGAE
jgi:zinc protease